MQTPRESVAGEPEERIVIRPHSPHGFPRHGLRELDIPDHTLVAAIF